MNYEALTGAKAGGRKFYKQLLAMQDRLFLDTVDDSIKPTDRAACARAWEDLEERKRVMRGKPLPGHLRPDNKSTAGRKWSDVASGDATKRDGA